MKKITVQKPAVASEEEKRAFETVYGNLFYAGKNLKSITLATCGEGRDDSAAAWKLAQCAAKHGEKVLLVDVDFCGSRMAETYGIDFGKDGLGLAQYLNGRCGLDDVIYETNLENIFLSPVGANVANPLLLFASPEFKGLVDAVSEQFDRVLLLAPDNRKMSAAAAGFTDGAVLLVHDGKTPFRKLRTVKNCMEKAGSAVLGCVVLEAVQMKRYNA